MPTMTDFSLYENPYSHIEGDRDFPDTRGLLFPPVGGVSDDGSTLQGATGGICPPSWGRFNSSMRSSVQGWVTVASLGQDAGAYLNAAVWNGCLWLDITKQPITPPAASGDFEQLPQDAVPDTPYLFYIDERGAVHGASRAVFPGWAVCPMASAESMLKTAEGKWRGDLNWAPLCIFTTSATNRVTVWLVPVGNTLVFYMTEGNNRGLGSDWRRFSPFERVGREYIAEQNLWHQLDIDNYDNPETALTPWQNDGTEPEQQADEDVSEGQGDMGEMNLVGEANEDGDAGLDNPPPLSPALFVFSLAHTLGGYGIFEWANTLYYGQTEAPKPPLNPLGGRTPLQYVKEFLKVGYMHVNWQLASNWPTPDTWLIYRQPWLYRFDPWSANGRGYYGGGPAFVPETLGYLTEWMNLYPPTIEGGRLASKDCKEDWSEKNWGEWAPELEITAEYETDLPNGHHLVLVLFGTEIGSTLCCGSIFGRQTLLEF